MTGLFDIREMMEFRAASRFPGLPDTHPAWRRLDSLEEEHHRLDAELGTRFKDVSELDERFHRLVGRLSRNRFFDNIRAVMSLIFPSHSQRNKRDETKRNPVAVQEHLAYIAGLRSRDPEQTYLGTVRKTGLSSRDMAGTGGS